LNDRCSETLKVKVCKIVYSLEKRKLELSASAREVKILLKSGPILRIRFAEIGLSFTTLQN